MLTAETIEALAHYPKDWRIGQKAGEWIIFVPDDPYVSVSGLFGIPQWQDVSRGKDLDETIQSGLLTTYSCDEPRCTVARVTDQRVKHKHQLRPKNAMEVLFDRAFPPIPTVKAGDTITISTSPYGSLDPTTG